MSGAGRKATAAKGAGKKRTGSLWTDADEDESPERQQPRKAVDAHAVLEDNGERGSWSSWPLFVVAARAGHA